MHILQTGRGRCLLGLALALAFVPLAGCGGGGGSETVGVTNNNSTRGTLTLKLTFPPTGKAAMPKLGIKSKGSVTRAPYAGNIPLGTKVVKLVVTDQPSGTILASRSVTAPTDNSGNLPTLVNINFPAIPAGDVKVDATAFPDANAQLNPIATGSATGTVQPLQTTSLTVNMALTLNSLTINPASALVSDFPTDPDHTIVLNAVVVDAANQPLVMPLYWTTSDPDVAAMATNPNNAGQVTITGLAPGTSTITLYEPNSGLTATCAITVFAGG